MPLMVWDDSYSVRVDKIDQQHKQLFRLINQLHDAMTQGKGKEVLNQIFDGLISYTSSHFSDEERMMTAYGYPQTASHRKEHESLVTQVSELQKEHASGKLGVSIQTRDFLKSWLENHIRTVDMKYAPFFQQKGAR